MKMSYTILFKYAQFALMITSLTRRSSTSFRASK